MPNLLSGQLEFDDDDGLPLAGGTVGFYQVGTLNPITTYQDQALTLPNNNPIILDKSGRAFIWGAPNTVYRQVLKSVNGDTVWDRTTANNTATASILYNANQQFLDKNGKPMAGAMVFVYFANSNTLANTYIDELRTELNTNPIILDASGRASMWGVPGTSYRLVIKTIIGYNDAGQPLLQTYWDQSGISNNNLPPGFPSSIIQSGTFNPTYPTIPSIGYVGILDPTPRASPGLADANDDILGGEPLEVNMAGSNTALNAGGSSAVISSTAGGPTGVALVIPATLGGSKVTWIRGAYVTTAVPRYQSFMADLVGPDTANYAAIPANFTGSISGTILTVSSIIGPDDSDGYLVPGMSLSPGLPNTVIVSQLTGARGVVGTYQVNLSQTLPSTNITGTIVSTNSLTTTTIPLLPWVGVGVSLQAYYSYRDGTVNVRGQDASGWPMKHVDAYQGTANDGDAYMMMALYHAYNVTQDTRYAILANRMGVAQFNAGRWSGATARFDIPFVAEAGQVGLYTYNAPATPFTAAVVPQSLAPSGYAMQVNTTVSSGGYAGFGMWPSWSIGPNTPFNNIQITYLSDGSQRNLALTTTVQPSGTTFSFLLPLLSGVTGFQTLTVNSSDFWDLRNVVYDPQHADFTYSGAYGSGTSTLNLVQDKTNSFIIREWDFIYSNYVSGYAGMYFGVPSNVSSVGTTGIYLDLNVLATQSGGVPANRAALTIEVIDANGTAWSAFLVDVGQYDLPLGVSQVFIPWVSNNLNHLWGFTFQGTYSDTGPIIHPINEIKLNTFNSGTTQLKLQINNVRFQPINTMASETFNKVQGMQVAFPVNPSPYSIYISDITMGVQVNDGPPSDPLRYAGIPRWTYKWNQIGSSVGYGSWRGWTGCGYLWLSGWYLSGVFNPDNSKFIWEGMLDFLTDAQAEYQAQFPSLPPGPFVLDYGRPSWEALNKGGYVAGTYQTSTMNQWFSSSSDNWYGYMVRALLSVARFYYMSKDTQAKAILDLWMPWLDTHILPDGAYWWPPSDYYSDGTAGYTYKPVYSYTCIAAACMYKYLVDGDPIAFKWYRRLLDDIYARQRLTATGSLAGVYPLTAGSGYTTATVTPTVNAGAVAPVITPNIAGGLITHYNVVSAGSGITSITIAVTGDGSGATGNPYLTDLLVGAFSNEHTGWEAAEIINTYGILVNGPPPGGYAIFPLQAGPNDATALAGLLAFYKKATNSTGPRMLLPTGQPLHEFTWSSFHWGAGIEQPFIRDTEVKGASWTESLGPSIYAAVESGLYSGDWVWLKQLYDYAVELTGGVGADF